MKFREMIEKESKIPADSQKIIHNNKVLEFVNEEKLDKLGIKDNDMFLLEKIDSNAPPEMSFNDKFLMGSMPWLFADGAPLSGAVGRPPAGHPQMSSPGM